MDHEHPGFSDLAEAILGADVQRSEECLDTLGESAGLALRTLFDDALSVDYATNALVLVVNTATRHRVVLDIHKNADFMIMQSMIYDNHPLVFALVHHARMGGTTFEFGNGITAVVSWLISAKRLDTVKLVHEECTRAGAADVFCPRNIRDTYLRAAVVHGSGDIVNYLLDVNYTSTAPENLCASGMRAFVAGPVVADPVLMHDILDTMDMHDQYEAYAPELADFIVACLGLRHHDAARVAWHRAILHAQPLSAQTVWEKFIASSQGSPDFESVWWIFCAAASGGQRIDFRTDALTAGAFRSQFLKHTITLLKFVNEQEWKINVHMDSSGIFATAIREVHDALAHTVIEMTSSAAWESIPRIREILSCANVVLPRTLELVFTKFGYVVPTDDIIARDVDDLAGIDNIPLLFAFFEDSRDTGGPYALRLRQIYDRYRPIEMAAFRAIDQAYCDALPRIRGQPPTQLPAGVVEVIVARILPNNWERLARYGVANWD